jgi:flagellar hook-basal body complex protein FliE
MAIPAHNIDEVLLELDKIIDQSVADNNHLGIFAYVYRRTTAQVKQAIIEKQFEDNDRMELMDVAFANLYLKAYQDFSQKKECSAAWQTAFTAGKSSVTILQHIMLGMNAHINLDLGVAAATFAPGQRMDALETDFMKVNLILKGLVNEMQERVARVSRLMRVLDWMGKNTDELIINFSMVKAREQAWNFACYLAQQYPAEQQPVIVKKDGHISAFGQLVEHPPGKLLKLAVKIVALVEEKDVKKIIDRLRND